MCAILRGRFPCVQSISVTLIAKDSVESSSASQLLPRRSEFSNSDVNCKLVGLTRYHMVNALSSRYYVA